MVKKYWICTEVPTTEELVFTKDKAYLAVNFADGMIKVVDDEGVVFNDYKDCVMTELTNMGYKFAEVVIPDHIGYFRATAASEKFQLNKVYEINTEKIDVNADHPLMNVVTDVTLLNENFDFSTKTEFLEYISAHFNSDITKITPADIAVMCNVAMNVRFVNGDFAAFHNDTLVTDDMDIPEFTPVFATNEEIANIKREMIECYTKFSHPWKNTGVDKELTKWNINKATLRAMFKSSPHYNGNQQLVFSDEHYRLNTNKNAGADFINWVNSVFDSNALLEPKRVLGYTYDELATVKAYYQATMPKVKPMIQGNNLYLMNYELMKKKREEIDKIDYIMETFLDERNTPESIKKQKDYKQLIRIIMDMKDEYIDDDIATKVNHYLPDVRARKGQKATKITGKIMRHFGIDKCTDYNKKFAKYADAINIIKIVRHTVISIHPMDYLTMSFGNSWSSCHTIDKDNIRNGGGNGYHGAYCSGTLSYMMDSASIIVYTVDREYEGNTFYEKDKINRCMFHIGKEKIVQGRCYPQAEDSNDELYKQLRALVHRTFAEIWGIPNLWVLKTSGLRDYITNSGTHYPDYYHSSKCNISTYKFAKNKQEVVHIGVKPVCTCCGREHGRSDHLHCCRGEHIKDDTTATDYTTDDVEAEPEAQYVYCECCDEVVERADAHLIDGEWYCDDCCFYCNYHECYEESDGEIYVTGLGYVCDSALDSGYVDYCECCGTYYRTDVLVWIDGEDRYVCDDCCSRYYTRDYYTDEYVHNDDIRMCCVCDAHVYYEDGETNENGEFICNHCLEAEED